MTEVLRVIEPGPFSTIQDLGRPAAIRSGVPPGGAMDRFALQAANLIVGNEAGAAGLECAIAGPELVALKACLFAATGADFDLHVNGAAVPSWTGIFLAAGDRVSFAGRRWGARVYIAVAGGIDGQRWLGSRSTYLLAALGGMHGRTLKSGDLLATAAEPPKPAISGRRLAEGLRPDYRDPVLAAMPGPHVGRLARQSRRDLFSQTYVISKDADRMGYRLEGPRLELTGDELLSFGLVAGALQVPNSGQPILLMADHQTAGGYPVAACVVSPDLPKAAQLLPGDSVRFKEVTVSEARARRGRLQSALAGLH